MCVPGGRNSHLHNGRLFLPSGKIEENPLLIIRFSIFVKNMGVKKDALGATTVTDRVQICLLWSDPSPGRFAVGGQRTGGTPCFVFSACPALGAMSSPCFPCIGYSREDRRFGRRDTYPIIKPTRIMLAPATNQRRVWLFLSPSTSRCSSPTCLVFVLSS